MSFFKNRFFTHSQVQGQSFDELVKSIEKLSTGCEFGELTT